MTFFFWSLVAFNAGCLVLILAMSWASVFRNFAGAALNPLVIFAFLALFFNLDFIYLFRNPGLEFLETKSIISIADVLNAYCAYTLIELGALAGFVLALAMHENLARNFDVARARPIRSFEPPKLLAAQIIFMAGLLTAMIMLFRSGGDANLSYQVITRENPAIAVFAWLQPTCLALVLAHSRRPISNGSLFATAASVLVLVFSGGARAMPLVCGLVFLVAYSDSRRLPAWLYAPAIPILGLFLAVSRYAFRENDFSGSFSQYLGEHGGLLSLFFSGEEIGFAKTFTAVYSFAPDLQVFPAHSLFALLLAPIPRSIIPWKPFGSSAVFTSYFSPERWELTKSETLITGFGDTVWQFGTIGAMIAMILLGFIWISICIFLINGPKNRMIELLPTALWCGYGFMRGDLFNIGLLLWPALFVIIFHRVLSFMLSSIGQALPANWYAHARSAADKSL
jgi:hypothetical protein